MTKDLATGLETTKVSAFDRISELEIENRSLKQSIAGYDQQILNLKREVLELRQVIGGG